MMEAKQQKKLRGLHLAHIKHDGVKASANSLRESRSAEAVTDCRTFEVLPAITGQKVTFVPK